MPKSSIHKSSKSQNRSFIWHHDWLVPIESEIEVKIEKEDARVEYQVVHPV